MRRPCCACLAGALLLTAGCGWQTYREQPLDSAAWLGAFAERRFDQAGLLEFLAQRGVIADVMPPAAWTPAQLEIAALYFSPELAVARAQLAIAEASELTAGARPNPELGIDLEHHSATDGGRTPWSAGPTLALPFEGFGQRAARRELAAAQTGAARIDLAGAEREVRRAVRDRCLEAQTGGTALQLLRARTALLREGVARLDKRRELEIASDLEVSLMQIDAQRAWLEESAATVRAGTLHAALASAIGVPPSALSAIEIDLREMDADPPPHDVDIGTLQRHALTGRADLRRALQDYAIAEAGLKREIAGQYPDITLTPGYFFDQADNIWMLGTSLVLPLFHRNEGPIAEAEARRALAARRVESLQARVVAEVQTAAAQFAAAMQVLAEAHTILDAVTEQERRMRREFELGQTDRLALIRAELTTLEARQAREVLRAEAWRRRFALDDATQLPLDAPPPAADTGS